MNSLALALLQGGVYPSNQEETGGMNSAPIQKGLYFRQFMPTSSAVRFFNCYFAFHFHLIAFFID